MKFLFFKMHVAPKERKVVKRHMWPLQKIYFSTWFTFPISSTTAVLKTRFLFTSAARNSYHCYRLSEVISACPTYMCWYKALPFFKEYLMYRPLQPFRNAKHSGQIDTYCLITREKWETDLLSFCVIIKKISARTIPVNRINRIDKLNVITSWILDCTDYCEKKLCTMVLSC